MFFLLPVLAGVIGSAVSASEIALGIGAAAAIGAGIKGAVDLKDASDYRDAASFKYNSAMEEMEKEIAKTQDVVSAFAKLKVKVFNGILKKAVSFLEANKTVNPSRIENLSSSFHSSKEKFSHESVHGSIALGRDYESFESSPVIDDIVNIAIGGPVGFMIYGSESLTEAVRQNAEADIKVELIERDRKICKTLRKRIGEGTKLINAFSERLESLVSYGPSAAVAVLPMAETLFQILTIDLVDTEGKLCDSAYSFYRTKMKEVENA